MKRLMAKEKKCSKKHKFSFLCFTAKKRDVDEDDDEDEDEDDDKGASADDKWGAGGINRPITKSPQKYSLCPLHIAIEGGHLVSSV